MDDTDTATFLERVSTHDGVARIESIHGNTLVWNQLFTIPAQQTLTERGVTIVKHTDGTITLNGTVTSNGSIAGVAVQNVQGHKYLMHGHFSQFDATKAVFSSQFYGEDNSNRGVIITNNSANATWYYVVRVVEGATFDNVILKPQIFDLTKMFGAGNEPTVAEFERMFPASYYLYNAGELLSVNVEGVNAVGFNQWDEVWEVGGIYPSTGEDTPQTTRIRSKNYISVSADTPYFWNVPIGSGLAVAYYDTDHNYLSGLWVNPGGIYTTPNSACYVRFGTGDAYGGVYKNDICVNISDLTRNGTYETYMSDTREIPVSTYFPDGMKSAGSIHDELTMGKAFKRVGVVDLGSLTWGETDRTEGYRRFNAWNALTSPSISDTANILCARFIRDGHLTRGLPVDNSIYLYGSGALLCRCDAYTSAAAFKAAMSGVMLYYELAEPVETEIAPPLNMTYTVEQGGTESIVIPTGENSAAPTMAIVYGVTIDGVVDKALSVIAPIEGAIASTNYSVNAYLVHGQQLYRVTSAIATGEAITPGTNCVACTVMGEVIRLTA